MTEKTLYLETMGCQMNVLDSELVEGQLRRLGYRMVDDWAQADVVLINTCSVRDHAEQKVLSRLGAIRKAKRQRSNMVVGVIGCMAERDPDGIFAKMPHVDLVCGPGELNKIPALIEQCSAGFQCGTGFQPEGTQVENPPHRAAALSQSHSRRSTPLQRALEFDSVEALDLSREPAPGQRVLQSYVRVQRGCDKFCTFCVVPFTRGPERSRPPQQIVDEAKMLADRGAKEVTLVGQTVNSYVNQDDGRPVRFAELLERLNDEVDGIERIRFVTNYPGDFTDDILAAMRDLPKVCEYLHIPVQSGSDAVLQRMRRRYTVGRYVDLIDRARDTVPGITLASDFIVGFCGETEAEFQESVKLIERCRFKNIFVFKYSPRPDTVADKRGVDDVPDDVKSTRNIELLDLQESISMADNQRLIGSTFEVLVEGYSKAAVKAQEARPEPGAGERRSSSPSRWRRSDQLVGRSREDRILVFPGKPEHIGRLADVRVTAATALTLHGTLIEPSAGDAAKAPSIAVSLPVIEAM